MSKDVNVLFSSPGDVTIARSALIGVVNEVRPSFERHGISLTAWAFDFHVTPSVPHPSETVQIVIDREMPRKADGSLDYDLYVGIMSRRIGTPLPDAPSGTVHEFREALASFEATGRPRILFYFLNQSTFTGDPDPQMKGVLEFKEKYPGLYTSCSDERDLVARFRAHLLAVLLELLDPVGPFVPDVVLSPWWSKVAAEHERIRASYSPAVSDTSSKRVPEILRQLHSLFGRQAQLTLQERQCLAATLLALGLERADWDTFTRIACEESACGPVLLQTLARFADPPVLVPPLGPTRPDLIASLASVGTSLARTRNHLALGTPAHITSVDDWIALCTEKIECEHGIVRHHLSVPAWDWSGPLAEAVALETEVLWQEHRSVLTGQLMKFTVTQPVVALDCRLAWVPKTVLAMIRKRSKSSARSLQARPHFGTNELPAVEQLLPLPRSRASGPVQFHSGLDGWPRLLVSGVVVAEAGLQGTISYLPPDGEWVECVLECDEIGEYLPVFTVRLSRLEPHEMAALESSPEAEDLLASLGLWNELLERIWPRLMGSEPSKVDLTCAYHILNTSFDEAATDCPAFLRRRGLYWQALELIRERIANFDKTA